MAREIPNKPHPTPNPDGPHAGGSTRGTGAGPGRSSHPQDEPASEEPNSDSCLDDLDLILTQPIPEPDPALRSKSSSDVIVRPSQDQAAVPALKQERGKQPKTAEIFKHVGPLAVDVTPSTAAALSSSRTEPSSGTETLFEGSLVDASESSAASEQALRAVEWASDDDHLAEARVPWALLVLLSYASAVTLALTWVLWTGRTSRSADSPPAGASQAETESVPKVVNPSPVGKLPPLPAENVASLENAVQMGELEVTPLGISVTRLDLVRSIDPPDWRREESASLVLRLKLRNISRDHAFAPLERRFVREQTSGLDRAMIVTSQEQGINLFPLAVDSEWSIEGQDFAVLKPGESVETLIASEPGAADRLSDAMTWHVRIRTGPFRTDVLGVRFNKGDVEQ
jgi:hypothetical protein